VSESHDGEGDFSPRLAAETSRLMGSMEALGKRLRESMLSDVNDDGTPSRDWCRAFGHYRGGIAAMLTEQRERTKLRLLLDRGDRKALTDDEYAAELKALAMESVRELTDDELEAELTRRGVTS
jgi:hypothetical protein